MFGRGLGGGETYDQPFPCLKVKIIWGRFWRIFKTSQNNEGSEMILCVFTYNEFHTCEFKAITMI